MSILLLILRSLFHFRRTAAGVLLGVAVSGVVVVGALLVGDSVRFSLRRIVDDRLGRVEYALQGGERFFRAEWADEIARSVGSDTAPLLRLRGLVLADGGKSRASGIEVLGVDRRFWRLGAADPPGLGPGEAAVGLRLAERLELEAGEEILLRTAASGAMPAEAPLGPGSDAMFSLRLRVVEILDDSQFGRFDLLANHLSPLNLFVSLDELGRRIDRPGKANVILAASASEDRLRKALREWRLDDAGLDLRFMPGGGAAELVSERVFIEDPVAEAAYAAWPGARGVFTYFVNTVKRIAPEPETDGSRAQGGSTPYSFVSAAEGSGLEADEILITRWLAEDLGAGPSDLIELRYYVLNDEEALVERAARFRVRSVIPVESTEAGPLFPGISEVDSCRDWSPSIPIDLGRIREKDEDYWERFRGAPKAYISLPSARRLWGNRYGKLTAVRIQSEAAEGTTLLRRLSPAALGFSFLPVRQRGLAAGAGGVDFSQLFIGFSFFLLSAALMLTTLLVRFAVEERADENALLLAVGFRESRLVILRIVELLILSFFGGVLGGLTAVFYNNAILRGLETVWRDAVGIPMLRSQVNPRTLILGSLGSAVIGALAAAAAVRRRTARCPDSPGRPRLAAGIFCLLAAVGLSMAARFGGARNGTALFFASGGLMLAAGLFGFRSLLLNRARRPPSGPRSLGMRGAGRNRSRSLTVVALLASGIFILFGVGANRRSAAGGGERRASGTGGFAFYGETDLPVFFDLETPEGRQAAGLGGVGGLDFVGLRVREGDDASCLNLNRTRSPRLLGVDPAELAERDAFRFTEAAEGMEGSWLDLSVDFGPDTIPGLADRTVILWGLGLAVGDTLDYIDEAGRPFHVRLVGGIDNSIFQGSVLIAEKALRDRFSSAAGARVFLVDAAAPETARPEIVRSLRDFGLELIETSRRLAEFNRVENTYLSIFLSLGGLGLVLGSIGLAIVVGRNVQERRGELALMRAVGFRRGTLVRMIIWENGILLAGGALIGSVSGLLAAFPSVLAPGAEVPLGFMAVVLGALLANGLLWITAAAWLSTGGRLLPTLRDE